MEETKLKSLLDSIASFALVPHGFQRHKESIVRLSEEVLSITRNGRPSPADVAQRFVSFTNLSYPIILCCFPVPPSPSLAFASCEDLKPVLEAASRCQILTS